MASTQRRCVGVEVAAGGEVVGQGPGLVAGPGVEGGDELALVDQAVLEGEQAEEQVAVGGDGGHGRASREASTSDGCRAPTSGACGRGAPDRLDYLMTDHLMQPYCGRSDLFRVLGTPKGHAAQGRSSAGTVQVGFALLDRLCSPGQA